MDNIRCVIADIPNIMLADIVRRISEQNLNVEYVDDVQEGHLSSHIKKNKIDVVITGFDSMIVPSVGNEALKQFKDVAIVGLIEDGRRMCIYVDDAGPVELVELIKTAVQENRNRTTIDN